MINFTILFSNLKTFNELKNFFDSFIESFDNYEDKNFNFLFLNKFKDSINANNEYLYDSFNFKEIVNTFINYVYLKVPEKNVFFEIISGDSYKHSDINFYTFKNNIDVITFFIKDNVKFLPESKGKWYNEMLKQLNNDRDFVAVSGEYVKILNKEYFLPLFDCVLFKSFIFGLNEYFDDNYFTLKYAEYDFLYRIMNNKTEFRFVNGNDIGIIIDKSQYVYSNSDLDRDKRRLELKFSLSDERINNYRNGPVRGYEYVRYNFLKEKLKEFVKEYRFKPKILELGCGIPFYIDNIKDYISLYKGIDYEDNVLEFNRVEFYDIDYVSFEKGYVNDKEYISQIVTDYDIIIAYEILEHIDNMEDIVEVLVKSNKVLFLSVPYNEDRSTGFYHHKHFNIKEDTFKKYSNNFEFYYQTNDCSLYSFDKKVFLDDSAIKTLIMYLNPMILERVYLINLFNNDDLKYLDVFIKYTINNFNKDSLLYYVFFPFYMEDEVVGIFKKNDLITNVFFNETFIEVKMNRIFENVIFPFYFKKL